jgi:hypothetical protein
MGLPEAWESGTCTKLAKRKILLTLAHHLRTAAALYCLLHACGAAPGLL